MYHNSRLNEVSIIIVDTGTDWSLRPGDNEGLGPGFRGLLSSLSPTGRNLLFGLSRPELDISSAAGFGGRTRSPGPFWRGRGKLLRQGHVEILRVGVEVEGMDITRTTHDPLNPKPGDKEGWESLDP